MLLEIDLHDVELGSFRFRLSLPSTTSPLLVSTNPVHIHTATHGRHKSLRSVRRAVKVDHLGHALLSPSVGLDSAVLMPITVSL